MATSDSEKAEVLNEFVSDGMNFLFDRIHLQNAHRVNKFYRETPIQEQPVPLSRVPHTCHNSFTLL